MIPEECVLLVPFKKTKTKMTAQASALVYLTLAASTALPSLAAFPQVEKLLQNECVSVCQRFHIIP